MVESWSRDPFPTSDWSQGCTTTGYETNIRQDCTTVTETVCSNVTVAKFNKTIDTKCTTKAIYILILNFVIILLLLLSRLTRNANPPKLMCPSSGARRVMRNGANTSTKR